MTRTNLTRLGGLAPVLGGLLAATINTLNFVLIQSMGRPLEPFARISLRAPRAIGCRHSVVSRYWAHGPVRFAREALQARYFGPGPGLPFGPRFLILCSVRYSLRLVSTTYGHGREHQEPLGHLPRERRRPCGSPAVGRRGTAPRSDRLQG